jgi:hypothetical protein
MSGRASAFLASLLATFVLTAVSAFATAPVLNSVTVTAGQATIHWSLPPCVESRLIETATDSATNSFGYFTPANVYSFDVPHNPKTDTSVAVDDPSGGSFVAGTYYAHVGGVDRRKPNPPIEFSNTVTFVVDAAGNGTGVGIPGTTTPCPSGGGGGGGGGGGSGSGGNVVKTTPFGKLTYARVQAVGKLAVVARCSEAGTLKAVASVKVPGRAKPYRFKPISKKAGANVWVKLRLRLSKKPLRAVKRALKKGNHLKAKVKVTAKNKAGIARSQKATIRLKA